MQTFGSGVLSVPKNCMSAEAICSRHPTRVPLHEANERRRGEGFSSGRGPSVPERPGLLRVFDLSVFKHKFLPHNLYQLSQLVPQAEKLQHNYNMNARLIQAILGHVCVSLFFSSDAPTSNQMDPPHSSTPLSSLVAPKERCGQGSMSFGAPKDGHDLEVPTLCEMKFQNSIRCVAQITRTDTLRPCVFPPRQSFWFGESMVRSILLRQGREKLGFLLFQFKWLMMPLSQVNVDNLLSFFKNVLFFYCVIFLVALLLFISLSLWSKFRQGTMLSASSKAFLHCRRKSSHFFVHSSDRTL